VVTPIRDAKDEAAKHVDDVAPELPVEKAIPERARAGAPASLADGSAWYPAGDLGSTKAGYTIELKDGGMVFDAVAVRCG